MLLPSVNGFGQLVGGFVLGIDACGAHGLESIKQACVLLGYNIQLLLGG
jgi:hypothetical protein